MKERDRNQRPSKNYEFAIELFLQKQQQKCFSLYQTMEILVILKEKFYKMN